MVKKQSIRVRMKPVIKALREGKKTWSDLRKLGVPEKTLDRILDYLEYWELARKEGVYWVWYEHLRVFGTKEYDLAIEHSCRLLPAFKNMREIGVIARHPLYFAAKEHLRSYPETYRKLEKFEKVFNERVRELLEKYGHLIRTPDQFVFFDTVKVKGKGPLGKFFSETKFKKRNLPYMLDFPEHLKDKEFNELKKTQEYRDLKELRDFLDNTGAFNERFELYGDLARDIYMLSLKVEVGLTPFEGSCSLCPKVQISNQLK
jgi:hypothetical protein